MMVGTMSIMRMTVIAILFGAVACVPAEPLLRWNAQPPSGGVQGSVRVAQIVNRRPEKKGADDLNRLGNARSGFGIPYTISSVDGNYGLPTPVDTTLRRFVDESLAAAGVGAGGYGPPTAQIIIEVSDLWCDGYMSYNATLGIDLVVLDPANMSARTRIPLRATGSGGNWQIAFQQAFNAAHAAAVNAFRDPRIREALVGAAGAAPVAAPGYPAPAAPAPATNSGCAKDTDCKGDRVCERGRCIDAR